MNSEKPPPIRVSVSGIEAKPIEMNTAPAQTIDWRALAGLPPFQMFAQEISGKMPGEDSLAFAIDVAMTMVEQAGDDAVLNLYCDWHTKKGYWPNETPFGQEK